MIIQNVVLYLKSVNWEVFDYAWGNSYRVIPFYLFFPPDKSGGYLQASPTEK